jgi:23S rRNA (guanine2445-N2)-methyltransferase / 23S rRNA (guanine2069-N7)-methyltransferase
VNDFPLLRRKHFALAEEFRNRLARMARHYRRWPARQGTECFRLYDRDIPNVPLAVDRYGECLHLAVYEKATAPATPRREQWIAYLARTAAEALGMSIDNVFVKRRRRQKDAAQYERQGEQRREWVVRENGLQFLVNLSDYLDTGLFLDHRVTRSLVRSEAAGRRFLNLFAYTGAFTVYAAAGGAASTTTVDLSNTYLRWAKQNLRLNEFTGKEHRLVRDDARKFLEYHRPGQAYDLAVVDPPTFSRSKKLDRDWDIQRDHADLLNRLLRLMTPGGAVYFSTNFRGFKLAAEELRRAETREITRQTIPPDFRESRIHRCWRIVKQAKL